MVAVVALAIVGPDRVLGSTPVTAPTACVALGKRVDHPLHRIVRTTASGRHDLTTTATQGQKKNQWNTTNSEVAGSATPSHRPNHSSVTRQRHQAHRWIEAKAW